MDERWKSLQLAAHEAIGLLWDEFAKEGREGAVFAPLAQYPTAAAWLAGSMSLSTDCITRKLAAMLAGWIQDPKHISMLRDMLEHERALFPEDSYSANSVGEDIMFAATRWAGAKDARVRGAGIEILACMVNDALMGTHWNTVHWAVANLYRVTNGKHLIFERLANLKEVQLAGQQFLQNVVEDLKRNDVATLDRLVTLPSPEVSLSTSDPNYASVASLWNAVASAEAATRPGH